MDTKVEHQDIAEQEPLESKPYASPEIVEYGKLCNLTLGEYDKEADTGIGGSTFTF